jgi:hypothetical protein
MAKMGVVVERDDGMMVRRKLQGEDVRMLGEEANEEEKKDNAQTEGVAPFKSNRDGLTVIIV